jgi:hypothetical protein
MPDSALSCSTLDVLMSMYTHGIKELVDKVKPPVLSFFDSAAGSVSQ